MGRRTKGHKEVEKSKENLSNPLIERKKKQKKEDVEGGEEIGRRKRDEGLFCTYMYDDTEQSTKYTGRTIYLYLHIYHKES